MGVQLPAPPGLPNPFFNPLPVTPQGVVATFLFKSSPQGFVLPTDSADNPNNPTPGQTGPVSLTVTCIVKENPQMTATPTTNPVENGATFSDHVRVLPRKLNIAATISNLGDSLLGLTTAIDPLTSVLNFLDTIHSNGEPFDFVSGMSIYRNMVSTSLDIDRQASSSKVVKFSMSLQELVIVNAQFVDQTPSNIDPSVSSSAVVQQNLGKQSPTPANTSQAAAATNTAFGPTKNVFGRIGIK